MLPSDTEEHDLYVQCTVCNTKNSDSLVTLCCKGSGPKNH